jgi:hypothetical protein
MKIFRLIIWLAIGFILFLIGLSIPGAKNPVHIILVVAGILIVLGFYLRTFRHMLTTSSLSKGRRMLWTVLIIAMPVIGNMLYVLIHRLGSSHQVVKQEV